MKYLAAILLIANYLAIDANKALVLPTIVENGLTDAESDLAMATAILQSEKTKDKASISESIVNELTEKFGDVWNVLITNYNQYDANSISVRFQEKKLLRFVHEKSEYIIIKSEQPPNARQMFANVLSQALTATVKRIIVYDANNKVDDIASIVNASLKLNYSDCTANNNGWINTSGYCYQLMADSALVDLRRKYGGRWSVTAAETNSHFQSFTQRRFWCIFDVVNCVENELPMHYSFVELSEIIDDDV